MKCNLDSKYQQLVRTTTKFKSNIKTNFLISSKCKPQYRPEPLEQRRAHLHKINFNHNKTVTHLNLSQHDGIFNTFV